MSAFYKMDPVAWDDGTAMLSLELEGAYLRVVNAINKSDRPVRNIPAILGGMWRCNARKAKRLLAELIAAGKLSIDGDYIIDERAMNDVSMRRDIANERALIGKQGGINSGKSRRKSRQNADIGEAVASIRANQNRIEENRESTLEDFSKEKSPNAAVGGSPELDLQDAQPEAVPIEPDPPYDPVKELFDACVTVFAMANIPEREARRFLGRLRRDYTDDAIMAALGQAQAARAVEPKSYLLGVLKQNKRDRKTVSNGGIEVAVDGTIIRDA